MACHSAQCLACGSRWPSSCTGAWRRLARPSASLCCPLSCRASTGFNDGCSFPHPTTESSLSRVADHDGEDAERHVQRRTHAGDTQAFEWTENGFDFWKQRVPKEHIFGNPWLADMVGCSVDYSVRQIYGANVSVPLRVLFESASSTPRGRKPLPMFLSRTIRRRGFPFHRRWEKWGHNNSCTVTGIRRLWSISIKERRVNEVTASLATMIDELTEEWYHDDREKCECVGESTDEEKAEEQDDEQSPQAVAASASRPDGAEDRPSAGRDEKPPPAIRSRHNVVPDWKACIPKSHSCCAMSCRCTLVTNQRTLVLLNSANSVCVCEVCSGCVRVGAVLTVRPAATCLQYSASCTHVSFLSALSCRPLQLTSQSVPLMPSRMFRCVRSGTPPQSTRTSGSGLPRVCGRLRELGRRCGQGHLQPSCTLGRPKGLGRGGGRGDQREPIECGVARGPYARGERGEPQVPDEMIPAN